MTQQYIRYPDNSGSGGTVTSVGLSAPSIFTVSGSPVTTSGTLTFTLINQSPNLVFAGPASGGASAPTFRSLVAADIPDIGGTYLRLNQASQQTVIGPPLFQDGIEIGSGSVITETGSILDFQANSGIVYFTSDYWGKTTSIDFWSTTYPYNEPATGDVLTYDATTDTARFAPPSGGGGGTPGGSDTQVQFNDAGSFGGDAGFTYNKTTDTATIGNLIDSGLTASKVVFSDGSKQLTSTGIGTSAQFIKGDGSLDSNTYLTGPIEEPRVTIGDGEDLIIPNTSGVFWIAPFSGNITQWRIWTGDDASATCEVDVKKNGTTIGQNIDLSAASSNSGTGLSIAFVTGDKLSFNVDANTSATKIIVQLVAEE